jgi:hypothetical protein
VVDAVSAPKRIQRKRTKGWRMPHGAIYCGRPGRMGNPFIVGQPHRLNGGRPVKDAAQAVELYELHTGPMGSYEFDSEDLERLRGKDLACWCPLDAPCHADVLLRAANAPEGDR